MLSKNNQTLRIEKDAVTKVPHYGLRKLSVGVASVLLGTTAGLAMMGGVSHADTVDANASAAPAPAATAQAVPQATTQQATQQTAVPNAALSTTQVPAQTVSTQTASVTPATQSAVTQSTTTSQSTGPTQLTTANNNVNALYGASLVQADNTAGNDSGYVNYNLLTGESTPVPNNQQNQPVVHTPTNTPFDSNLTDKQEQWNISVGYNWAKDNYTGDNGVTIYAVPDKVGQAAADATKLNIKVTDRNPGSHNELTVTATGNTVAGQPVVTFEREYDGTEGSVTDPTAIANHNAKGHHYTVYNITLPLQTDFGWQYQQPTTAYNAEVTLDHVNNGVTIDHSKDIQDSVDVYQYADQIKFHYVSDDGKIDRTVDGPLLQSSDPNQTKFNYNIPEGYKLKNSDQVTGAGFKESQSQKGMPALVHYGSEGWPANDTNPNETIVEVPLTLAAVKSSWTGQFIDLNNNGANVGNPVVVNGNSGDSEPVSMSIPDGYQLASGANIPTNVTLTDTPQTVKIPLVHKTHVVHPGDPDSTGMDLKHDATRTINIKGLDGVENAPKSQQQKAEVTRTATVDDVTKKVLSYSPWTKAQWDSYEAPTVEHYKATPTSIAQAPVDENTKDTSVDINYVKDAGSWTGQFIDLDNNNAPVGSAVTIAGDAGTTGQPKMTVPTGYELASGQSVPTSVTFTDGPQTVTIGLKHKTHVVHPGDPDAGNYNLVHDAIRTINLKGLDKVKNAPKGDVQKAEVSRTATVDDVTKKVLSYSPWSKASWASYQAPKVEHYTATPGSIAEAAVNENTKDMAVDINYQEVVGSWTGQFVDTDDNNKPVGEPVTISGEEGSTGTPAMTIPDGYELVPGQSIPTSVTFTNAPQAATIGLKHKTHTVKPGDPDAGNFDLVHDATRTINFKGLDKVANAPKSEQQKAEVTRTAVVDDVTKKAVSYTPWTTSSWAKYDAPKIDGYKATPASIAEAQVTNETKDTSVDIVYVSDEGSWTGQFVDGDENNKTVGNPVTVSGKEGSNQKINMPIPDGYELAPGQSIPTSAIMTDGPVQAQIVLKHKHELVNAGDPDAKKYNLDLKKAVTRTIEFKGLDDKLDPVVQKVVLLRSADVDLVTKQAVYTNWSTDQWQKFDVPSVDGYTPDKTEIDAENVNGDTQDQLVVVTYHKNNDNQTPETPTRDTAPAPSQTPAADNNGGGVVAAQPAAQTAVAPSPVLAAAAPVASVAAPAPAAAPAASLPQTGNNKSAALMAMGLAMASISLGSALLKKREA